MAAIGNDTSNKPPAWLPKTNTPAMNQDRMAGDKGYGYGSAPQTVNTTPATNKNNGAIPVVATAQLHGDHLPYAPSMFDNPLARTMWKDVNARDYPQTTWGTMQPGTGVQHAPAWMQYRNPYNYMTTNGSLSTGNDQRVLMQTPQGRVMVAPNSTIQPAAPQAPAPWWKPTWQALQGTTPQKPGGFLGVRG